MKTNQSEDPRYTAFLVDELNDETAATIKQSAADDRAIQQELDETKSLLAELNRFYQSGPKLRLTPEQIDATFEAIDQPNKTWYSRWLKVCGPLTAMGLASLILWNNQRPHATYSESNVTDESTGYEVHDLTQAVGENKKVAREKADTLGDKMPSPKSNPSSITGLERSSSNPQVALSTSPLHSSRSFSSISKDLDPQTTKALVQSDSRFNGFGSQTGKIEAPKSFLTTRRHENSSPESSSIESYRPFIENAFISVQNDPLSTFSVDVDTASYANVRRFLNLGQKPPKDAVRVEELINYFSYNYPQPKKGRLFSVTMETASSPWKPKHRLVRIGLKGKEFGWTNRPPINLVFLIDVSGSMSQQNKLPLLQKSLRLVVDKLTAKDSVAMVVYAGASGLALPPTPGDQKQKIMDAIFNLRAGGSTNGGEGISLAYQTAKRRFKAGAVNRVILATDGDFNVGVSQRGDLVRLIQEHAQTQIQLTVLGFGMGNYKDDTLEMLADKGNGNYAYIDSINEAKKVLVEEVGANFITIAKDVKLQVEFNPRQVSHYRLIGYENRLLAHQDFNNDEKDAGDIGSGHTVTALYEIVPHGVTPPKTAKIDSLKYQTPRSRAEDSDELLTLKMRFKKPGGKKSQLVSHSLIDDNRSFREASGDMQFASAVALFGMRLRESSLAGKASWDLIIKVAKQHLGDDSYRDEFLRLVSKAAALYGSE